MVKTTLAYIRLYLGGLTPGPLAFFFLTLRKICVCFVCHKNSPKVKKILDPPLNTVFNRNYKHALILLYKHARPITLFIRVKLTNNMLMIKRKKKNLLSRETVNTSLTHYGKVTVNYFHNYCTMLLL